MRWSTGQDSNLRTKDLQTFSLNHSDTRAYREPVAGFAPAKFLRPGVDTYFDFSRQSYYNKKPPEGGPLLVTSDGAPANHTHYSALMALLLYHKSNKTVVFVPPKPPVTLVQEPIVD